MINKVKATSLRDKIKRFLQINKMNAQVFILIFDDDENFICGHGCPACTNKALEEFLRKNDDEKHNCVRVNRMVN